MLQMMLADVKGRRFQFEHATNMQEAFLSLSKKPAQIVLLSLTLGAHAGLQNLQAIQEKFPAIPVIIFTELDNQSLATEALHMGAQDFLVKGKLDGSLLSRVISYGIERHSVMQEMRIKNKELERLNSLKTEFVSTVSHELRTPLTILISATNNLLDGAYGKLTLPQRKWMKKIETQAMKLLDMISELLDLSKLQSGLAHWKEKPVDMSELVENTVHNLQPIAKDKHVILTSEIDTKEFTVSGDPKRLEQVLSNLITNAFKFTPEQGTIRVETSKDDGFAIICVSDTGPGIAAENQGLIFEKFRQIRSNDEDGSPTKGIGLGLAICKEIVEHHQGKIWVESELGQGSRFLFSLPLEKQNEIEKQRAA